MVQNSKPEERLMGFLTALDLIAGAALGQRRIASNPT